MTYTTEQIEEFKDLITSPGWRLLSQWATNEYGPLVLSRVANEEDDTKALLQLRQARAIQGAVSALLEYPSRIVSKYTVNDAPSPSRGGL